MVNRRFSRLQELMEGKGLDLVVYAPGPDFQYLTGGDAKWRSHKDLTPTGKALYVPRVGEPLLIQSPGESTPREWGFDVAEAEGPEASVGEALKRFEAPRVVATGRYVGSSLLLALARAVRGARFTSAGGLLDGLRMVKSGEELRRLEEVAALTDRVMGRVVESLGEGSTMGGTEALAEYLAKLEGATHTSFPPTAGFSRPGAVGQGIFNQDKGEALVEGTCIAFDVGFVQGGYCSDWGRSFFYGDPPARLEEGYRALAGAQEEAVDAICGEAQRVDQVFDVVERSLRREGYAGELLARLPHRVVGHQIGVEVHENPWLRPGGSVAFQEGMVFCLEPKLWFKGEYYLRVEDMVAIKNGRARFLTGFDRSLFKL